MIIKPVLFRTNFKLDINELNCCDKTDTLSLADMTNILSISNSVKSNSPLFTPQSSSIPVTLVANSFANSPRANNRFYPVQDL